MVTRGCGCAGACAGAGAALARFATSTAVKMMLRACRWLPLSPGREGWAHVALRASATRRRLIIDHHAPGNAADRDRDDGLAALGVDHGDVVAEAVGDIELALVARERDAPGALADQDIALDLAARNLDDSYMGGMAERHIGGLAVLGHDQADRRHVALAHAGRQELDLAGHGEAGAVD